MLEIMSNEAESSAKIIAVSYTHLDVYKRQLLRHCQEVQIVIFPLFWDLHLQKIRRYWDCVLFMIRKESIMAVSYTHLDVYKRQVDAPLDMRMDQRQTQTAGDIVNGYEEKELYLSLIHISGSTQNRWLLYCKIQEKISNDRH